MNCAVCDKSLSKKRARLINGRIVCSACMWKPAIATAARQGGDVKQAPGEAPQSGGVKQPHRPNLNSRIQNDREA